MDDDFFKDYPPVGAAGSSGTGAQPTQQAIPLGMPYTDEGAGPVREDLNPFGIAEDLYEHEPSAAHVPSPDFDNIDPVHTIHGHPTSHDPNPLDPDLGGPPPPDDAPAECEAVTAWRVSFAKNLQEKAEAERRGKAERAEAAREALVHMNSRWVGQCKAAHDANLIREKELLRDRDGIIARMSKPGEPPAWNVVPELVDMSGKFKEGARDTSRMRQVLLRLKTHN